MRLKLVHLVLAIGLWPITPVVASDRSEFELAQKQDTIEAYQAFVNGDHKLGTKYMAAAFQRLDELQFERASKSDTLEAWDTYLKLRVSTSGAGSEDRGTRARAAIDRLAGDRVREAQRKALATPTWDNLKAFWDRYPYDIPGSIAAELPQLRFELAQAVGTWGAYRLYEKEYPQGELTARLKHNVMYRIFAAKPNITDALSYLDDYPQGEHSASLRQWIDADQSTRPAGNLRVGWVGGRTLDVLQVPTGEVALIGGNLREVTTTKRPKQGSFLVAQFTVYNPGESVRLLPSQVWLGDGKARRHVATELVASAGGLTVVSDEPGVALRGIANTVGAVFDLPRAGRESLRLYVNGTPTLRVSEMPALP